MQVNVRGYLFGVQKNPKELSIDWYNIDDHGNMVTLEDSSVYSAFYFLFNE